MAIMCVNSRISEGCAEMEEMGQISAHARIFLISLRTLG